MFAHRVLGVVLGADDVTINRAFFALLRNSEPRAGQACEQTRGPGWVADPTERRLVPMEAL